MNQKVAKAFRNKCFIDCRFNKPAYKNFKRLWKALPWNKRNRRMINV